MADKQSAIAKLREKRAKEAMEYKSSHDVERVHHLIAAASLIRDWPAAAALAASLTKELTALNAKQVELDAKEKAEQEKEVAEAVAADAQPQPTQEGTEESPPTRGTARSR